MDKRKKIIFFIVISVIIFFIIILFWKTENKTVEVLLPRGSSPVTISKILKNADLIVSQKAFVAMVKMFNYSKRLQAGLYEFNSKDNMFTIMTKIKNGDSKNYRLTIPEGFNVKQIAALLEEKNICKSQDFINSASEKNMEGYLFPNTYFIVPQTPADEIINIMNGEFKKFWNAEIDEAANRINMSQKDIIILASIVEKEAVSPEERPVIAGVFLNRLKKNMRLESCSTVLYAIGINKERLTFEDLKYESKYNTYKHTGLPPGPICNPGEAAVKAVLYPKITDNLYFVSKGNGTHYFSSTFEQHKKNKIVSKKKAKK